MLNGESGSTRLMLHFFYKIIWILFAFQMKDGHHDTKLFGLQSDFLSFIPAVVAFTLTLERLRLASALPPSLPPPPPPTPPPLPDVNRDTTRPAPAADAPIHSSLASIKFSVLIFFNSFAFFFFESRKCATLE